MQNMEQMKKDRFEEAVYVLTVAAEGALLPTYASDEASGADVRAHIETDRVIPAGSAQLIPTGLRFSIPEGYEIQVRPRSGLALKHQVTLVNSPGTIDSDYRGELGVILINHGKGDFVVTPGMRIAQLVLSPVIRGSYQMISEEELSETSRGSGGFGHTGTH